MRRLLVCATLVTTLLGAAACGSDSASDSRSGASPTAEVTADVAANSNEVCDATKKLFADSAQELGEKLATLITTQPGDAAGQQQALDLIRDLFTKWSVGLREQAGRALDPDLKAGLTDSAAVIETATAQFKTFDDIGQAGDALDNPQMDAAGKKIEKVCGPIG